jgi:hypothetical protein
VAIPSYGEYVATLSRLTEHVDPTTPTAETAAIKMAAELPSQPSTGSKLTLRPQPDSKS